MRWADLAPWGVSLEHDFVVGQGLDDLQIRLRLERAAVEADVESQSNQLLCVFQGTIEGVHDTAAPNLLLVVLDDLDEVIVRIATVQEQGKLKFVGQLELFLEVLLLDIGFAEVQAVIVQADFSDGDDFVFVFFDLVQKLAEVVVWADQEFAASSGMAADGTKNPFYKMLPFISLQQVGQK